MVLRVSSGSVVLPPDQYMASLAKRRMAVGALLRDESGRVLLVDPSYKVPWDLPGGAVEAEESPHAACRREVAEELGLDRHPGPIVAVDWVSSRPERPEGVVIVYDGGSGQGFGRWDGRSRRLMRASSRMPAEQQNIHSGRDGGRWPGQ
jgi:8-oxo-dGTP pyrophosphatase MutT (NUDIX family)